MLAEENRLIVVVHSYKGGTGKTLLSANLATAFAVKGKKTCLLDMDFRAPSLSSLFETNEPRYWLNDYLNGACQAEDVLQSCCFEGLGNDRLFVGLANPSIEAIRDMVSKDRKWEMQALLRLFAFRDSLFDRLGFDYLILDTSPGFHYSSINAIVIADVALVVTTLDGADVEGTRIMLHGLYEHFERKTAVILNKVPHDLLHSQRIEEVQKALGFAQAISGVDIACSCDLAVSESPCFFVCRKRNHPFARTLERIASGIAACQKFYESSQKATG